MRNVLKIPYLEPVELAVKQMTISEKFITLLLTVLLTVGAFGMLHNLDKYVSASVPAGGGSFAEAIVGTPRFVNPLLALTDSDRDIVMLTYAGLMRPTGSGMLVPDMAESYTISDSGEEYIFTLKEGLKFHDNKPVTVDDVIFTIETVQNPTLKSTKRADWDGIQIKKTGEREVTFILPRPYAPFLENTTIGILPKHLWENVNVQEFSYSNLNTNPIGSGPYQIDNISYDKSGIPQSYQLKAFKSYSLGKPYIKDITLTFLSDKDELVTQWQSNSSQAISGIYLQDHTEEQSSVNRITYPRIFAVFFNQDNAKIFASKHVRSALNKSIDKELLIEEVMNGYASVLTSAIPSGVLSNNNMQSVDRMSADERLEEANETLISGGWKFEAIKTGDSDEENEDEEEVELQKFWQKKDGQVLTFTLATANTPELTHAAQILQNTWAELGVDVKVDIFDVNDLNQNVIRARNYDALLFGEVVGRSLDLFAFWHSSQRDDPGLNIAMYANSKMDGLLEKARAESDTHKREELHIKIAEIMESDIPAIFLYSPDFIYMLPKHIKGADLQLIATPSERFASVHKWYVETDRVWNIFIK